MKKTTKKTIKKVKVVKPIKAWAVVQLDGKIRANDIWSSSNKKDIELYLGEKWVEVLITPFK